MMLSVARAARQQEAANADFRAGDSRVQDAGSKLDLI
jgi:hypothetical protein